MNLSLIHECKLFNEIVMNFLTIELCLKDKELTFLYSASKLMHHLRPIDILRDAIIFIPRIEDE